jgi:hypothetical protein
MCEPQNEQKTKPKPDNYADWLELFYLQAVLPEQNYIIPLPAIKNSTTRYTALCFKFCYVWQHCLQAATSGVAKRFGMRRRCNSIRLVFVRFAPFPH